MGAALGVVPAFGVMSAVPPLGVSSARRRAFSGSPRGRVVAVASSALLATLGVIAWTSDSSPFYLLAVGMTLVGWLGSASAGPAARWALFCLAATILTHAVFFGEDRYHVVSRCSASWRRVPSGHAEETFNPPHGRNTAPTREEELR
jgi:hypothetical protein